MMPEPMMPPPPVMQPMQQVEVIRPMPPMQLVEVIPPIQPIEVIQPAQPIPPPMPLPEAAAFVPFNRSPIQRLRSYSTDYLPLNAPIVNQNTNCNNEHPIS